jgi:PAS domain S-box-containing protein
MKSGEYRWFRARGQAVWDDAGKPLRMAGSLTDITDRQRADAERQKFVWLANNSHDFIGMCDMAFVPFYVNTAGLKLVGLPDVESACQVKVQDYFFPEDRDFITNDFFPRVLREGHGEVEIRVRHFQTHEPIWMLYRLINLIDQTGSVIGWATISSNITERKRAEERFRRVVEAAPNAIVMIDRQRKITLVNRRTEELFRYSRDELIGQAIEVLVPERFRPNHPELVERFLQQPQARTMGANRDLFGLKKDGGEVPIEIGLNPITTSEGFFVLASVIDITERKRVEDALRAAKEAADAANKLKSSFLANMSHEIRTPMNGIIGMAQLLARTELRSHQRDYLATIDESAHILLRLLNDILDFSKIEAGKLELEVGEFRLSECLARATQMLVLRAAEKGLEIACRIAPEIPDHLRGDAGRLQQVLVNLLGNAVKFTEAGEIFVNVNAESLTPERVRLRFSVSDTGIGISPDKHDQIFHPFEQAESSTTRRFGGTGLGLTISRQLVEMMHGRIWLDSEVGRGSTFHFSAEFDVSADQHLHTPTELETLTNLPVLVVDDNFTNRRILGEMLQHWHMQPILTDSAPAARDALRKAAESQHPIRLILLDHHMPGEDGFHFVESVAELLRREPCTIIMISSGSSPVDADQCQKHGIDRFMTKPVIASELLNEVLKQFGTRTAITSSEPPTAAAARVHPRRVLLVEDNEINRRVAIGLIRSRGHQVVIAENGQVALDTLADQEFDVVLMDMQMPVLDGYEATVLIRQREHKIGGHVPIVAMTAEALKGDRERCLATGMDDYIAKPISPAELYHAIERFPALCLSAETGTHGSDSPAASSVSETVNVSGSSPPPTSPVDWNVARKRLGSEPKLLREFCDLMKSQMPSLLADIRRAIETRDFKLLRRAAHTMKGSVSYFGAESLAQSALALEKVGREEVLDGASSMLTAIEPELARVLDAIAAGPPEVATL